MENESVIQFLANYKGLDLNETKSFLSEYLKDDDFLKMLFEAILIYHRHGQVLMGCGRFLTSHEKQICESIGFKITYANTEHALRIYSAERMALVLLSLKENDK